MVWSSQQHVESCAPSHLQLPTGSKALINYSGSNPTAAVKMQEVFGLADTPLLGGQMCQVPLVLELLSPAGRPLQVRRWGVRDTHLWLWLSFSCCICWHHPQRVMGEGFWVVLHQLVSVECSADNGVRCSGCGAQPCQRTSLCT